LGTQREEISYKIKNLLEKMAKLEHLVFYKLAPASDCSHVLSALEDNMTKIQSISLIGYEVHAAAFPNIEALCQ